MATGNSRSGSFIQISIPSYRLLDTAAENTGSLSVSLSASGSGSVRAPRPHHVFLVEVWHKGQRYHLEKRYTAFLLLHRELRKTYQTPPFPPKRVRNTNPRVLEDRRQGLESYLQAVVSYYPIPEVLLQFLSLPIRPKRDSLESVNTADSSDLTISHQPVFAFCRDPYVDSASSDSGSSLPDIVFKGVAHGLYYS